ncbi:MAG: toll/interleukin-1 receptor domain-containing protein [Gammaproteobacteria bacterium]|nr:toll/interleukin-1 receptor domain-containing protein [Gammaproteobacteria bacterium]
MDRPHASYKGDEPYVFVSYSHKETARVHPQLRWRQETGFNVWFDEGTEASIGWTEALAGAIEGARLFIFFVTPASVESQNCRNEVRSVVVRG